ncbi:STAS domain-containing protein [Sphaerisporangium aureirubrum]|uniref:STAS domain-containing protein n=1 Tax=Sphaerisporangium aureirubrum TaxID=1544736 RepID=A0ABW1NSF5_9ACTN
MNVLYEDGHLRIAWAGGGWVRVSGEVDLSNSAMLAGMLARLTAEHGSLDVDVAELEFVDLSGFRCLVQPSDAQETRPPRLHNVPPHLRRLMALLGWQQAHTTTGSGCSTVP